MSSCCILWCRARLPTSIRRASAGASARSRGFASASKTTTSARRRRSSPDTVSSPGSPGPAPIRQTEPAGFVGSSGLASGAEGISGTDGRRTSLVGREFRRWACHRGSGSSRTRPKRDPPPDRPPYAREPAHRRRRHRAGRPHASTGHGQASGRRRPLQVRATPAVPLADRRADDLRPLRRRGRRAHEPVAEPRADRLSGVGGRQRGRRRGLVAHPPPRGGAAGDVPARQPRRGGIRPLRHRPALRQARRTAASRSASRSPSSG